MAEEVVSKNLTGDYCQPGLLLPLMDESGWNRSIRAVVYLIALLYSFVGVSVVTDIFMSAVVSITSKTRKIYLAQTKSKKNGSYSSVGGVVAGIHDDQPEVVEVRVWNDTVANLTLMALGTSAPEILLACIEIIGHNFTSGDLGPGTIVGSAAFNLLGITAICIISIPVGQIRRIRQIKVFSVSTAFSILAYIWLFVMVSVWTPNVVEVWEAVLTFALFPILVFFCYSADKGWCGLKILQRNKNKRQLELGNLSPDENEKMIIERNFFKDGKLDKDNLVAFVREVKKYPGLSDEDAALLAASKIADAQPHTRLHYRIGAVRNLTGSRKLTPHLSVKLKEVYDTINEHPNAPNIGEVPENKVETHAVVEFHSATCAVKENVGSFPVTIWRHGNLDPVVTVKVESLDGSAKAKEDYEPVNEVVTFEAGEKEKKINVRIVDDNKWEPEEEFFLKISIVGEFNENEIQLGRINVMEITILDDDQPGVIAFEKRGLLVKESAGNAELHIIRRGGSDGEVTVTWRTIDETAINGRDFIGGSGEIVFGHLEVRQILLIPVIDDLRAERDEHFEVELTSASGGARIGTINRIAVTVTNDDAFNNAVDKLLVLTNTNVDALAIHRNTWIGQMKDALSVNGGDLENATCGDYILHLIAFNWKVLFSLIPPPTLLGGWLCFFVALFCVGAVTAVIGDIATIFGCTVGLRNTITAITLVALGTSLPDTFASRTAAVREQFADNSIGNITGSNSVNVFLGLGLPWMLAAIYHATQGTTFYVPSGSLGFSVLLFTIAACLAVSLLMARRYVSALGGAELGGPAIWRYLSGGFLVLLWILYVAMTCLQEYGIIKVEF